MSDNQVIDAQFMEEPPRDKAITRFQQPERDLALTPVFNLATAQNRLEELKKFVKSYLVEGEDFGTIPGTPKPTLYKPGADKLCDIYGLADEYEVTNRVEDWAKNLFDYELKCRLVSKRDGHLIATGVGSCNSYEGKYRWRETKRKCPKCGKEAIIKGKEEYGGGWLCWKKSDGCGAKFTENDQEITSQVAGRVENDDLATQKNTLLKMAKKRAKVDAVLSATRSSGLFTQDIEDWGSIADEKGSAAAAQEVATAKIKDLETKVSQQATARTFTVAPVPPPKDLVPLLKQSIEAAKVANPFPPAAKTHPLITKVEQGRGKAKNMYFIEWDKENIGVFNRHIFPYLKVGVPADFELTTSITGGKKYINIDRVYSIGGVEFDEESHPIIQRSEDLLPQELPADIPDEFQL